MSPTSLKLAIAGAVALTVLALVSLASQAGVFEGFDSDPMTSQIEGPDTALGAIIDNAPPPSWKAGVEERTAGTIRTGSVAFNAPSEMELDRTVMVQAILSADQTLEELKGKVTAAGETMGATLEVSDWMVAKLTGSRQDFVIEPVGLEDGGRKRVLPGKETQWKWDVKPISEGPGKLLHLTLYTLVADGRDEVPIEQLSKDFTIEVDVPLGRRASDFTENNWKWLWTTILVPLWGVLVRAIQKSKQGTPTGGDA